MLRKIIEQLEISFRNLELKLRDLGYHKHCKKCGKIISEYKGLGICNKCIQEIGIKQIKKEGK